MDESFGNRYITKTHGESCLKNPVSHFICNASDVNGSTKDVKAIGGSAYVPVVVGTPVPAVYPHFRKHVLHRLKFVNKFEIHSRSVASAFTCKVFSLEVFCQLD
jgi:hypothetical protein